MKTSCVQHPPNEPLIVIHQWQLEFCEGDAATAALLSYFEYWHNVKLEIQANAKANKMPSDPGLLQFHSEKELIDGILKIATSRVKIKKGIDFLVNKAVISIHPNPKPRYGFDKTRHFLFHPGVINSWLEGYMAEKPHDSSLSKNRQRLSKNRPPSSKNRPPSSKNRPPSSKNRPPSSTNERAIPEITTETATETSTETSTETTTTTTTATPIFSSTDGQNRSSSSGVDNESRGSPQGERTPSQNNGEPQNANATTASQVVTDKDANSGECDLIFDYALKDFSSEQKRRAMDMLKSIPIENKQLILDEFNRALSKGTVKSSWAYLSTLVKKYHTGEFTATSDLPEQRKKITPKADETEKQAAIDACPYCDETGWLSFRVPDQQNNGTPCDHNPKKIKALFVKIQAEQITTAQWRYRNPLQSTPPVRLSPPEKEQARAKLTAMIGGFR